MGILLESENFQEVFKKVSENKTNYLINFE
jgi:hypothetical protein